MRKQIQLNRHWFFTKDEIDVKHSTSPQGQEIDLPHTWNAKDGQDGGNDYYRGRCYYMKKLERPQLRSGEMAYLEFRGVNSSADVYLNGKHLCRHDGGYSTFRVDITSALAEENTLVVAVDNSPNRKVYPQKADFTFYGGIYRDVYLVTVPAAHFAMEDHGAPGIQVTAKVVGGTADILIKVRVENGDGRTVRVEVDGIGSRSIPVQNGCAQAGFTIFDARLWNGTYDPFLYTARAVLLSQGEADDEVSARFGCREFQFDKERGFLLNGKSYPLRGVARHQDFYGVGNAITREMMRNDIAIIREMGANTIRLAHYQHDQYFYDLCDETGIVVWTEIPYISEHIEEANENTASQLTELILQNYNHPCIACWGLSNEITAVGGFKKEILENHIKLNHLAHSLDATRSTVTANVFMLETDSPLLDVPDIISYNLYFGWYLGSLENNDEWFAGFRKKNPNRVIGLSEYGADGNPQFQTNAPERGDYSEQYQAVYHEHMLRFFEKNPYLWATHAWNMFDFAADGRDEGGKHGINQKGLVSFDRKLKKDAFYLYKAYWSEEPFVHICGRRYVDRVEETTQIKVYTNQSQVALYCDGRLVDKKSGSRILIFELPISDRHVVEARSGSCFDSISIRKVSAPNPNYSMTKGNIVNWFQEGELQFPKDAYSIKDTMRDIKKKSEGAVLIDRLMKQSKAKRGDVAQGVEMGEDMQRIMDAMSVEKLLQMAGDAIGPEQVLQLNRALNQIKK